MDFLTKTGRKIYERLADHCREKLKMEDIDSLELSMLANSFALYFEASESIKTLGVKMTFITEKGTYEQIRPEYTVLKTEYQNILKHGAKFGLNPGDRKKIFGIVKEERKASEFDQI